jgi:hypothetical protein
MHELEATYPQHLCQISQAQLVPQSPQNDEQYDVRWELKVVVQRAGALIELATTSRAAIRVIAKRGFAGQLSCCE